LLKNHKTHEVYMIKMKIVLEGLLEWPSKGRQ